MKILMLADTHYDDGSRQLHYPASKDAADGFDEWLANESPNFDLIAICGDITVKGTTHLSEHLYVREMMGSLGVPYIIVPGNHDLCPVKGMEKRYPDLEEYEYTKLENTNFYKVFGENGVRYSKVHNGVRFIGFAIRDEDPDNQLPWLAGELKKPEKKIVIGHYPLERTRSGGFCLDWDYSRIGKILPELMELLGSKQNGVLAYFCGHQHINSIVPMVNTYQIETASCVLGTTSYRIVEIREGYIDIQTERLPYMKGYAGELTLPERSADNTHKTVYEYHYGNSSDLSITLPLG